MKKVFKSYARAEVEVKRAEQRENASKTKIKQGKEGQQPYFNLKWERK